MAIERERDQVAQGVCYGSGASASHFIFSGKFAERAPNASKMEDAA